MESVYIVVLAVCLTGVYSYPWDNDNCGANSFPTNITKFCEDNPTGKAPYIQDCAAYFDCGFQFDPGHVPRYFEQHLKTCDYPDYFDPVSESCQPFYSVTCCDRIAPVAPCDYRQFKCPFAHCQPCEFNRPSCTGRTDGLYALENRPNIYFQCQQQRTSSAHIQSCPEDQMFDGRARQCSPARLS